MAARLILASSSPQRRKILQTNGYLFKVQASSVEEPDAGTFDFKQARWLVKDLAQKKALDVAQNYSGQDVFVLGADTLVVAQKTILGKPHDVAHARQMLQKISGHWQHVLTGVCLIRARDQKFKTVCQITRLRLKKMSADVIDDLAQKNLDKSGAYAVQDIRDAFLETLVGDLDNVIGLPIKSVKKLCKELKYGL